MSDRDHTPILHLTTEDAWESAGALFVPPDLDAEGFVHCSAPHQIAAVADARFEGRTDLVALTIDPTQLSAPIVWEDLADEGDEFPHVYGPIERSAVIQARPYRPGPDGRFPRPL